MNIIKLTLVVSAASLLAGSATAAPNAPWTPVFEASDSGADITVTGVKATGADVVVKGRRIEVAIEAGPRSRLKRRYRDATVKYVRVYGGRTPRVSVQLQHNAAITRRIAKAVTVKAEGATLHIHVPRLGALSKPPATTAAAATAKPAPNPQAPQTQAAPAPAAPPADTSPRSEAPPSSSGASAGGLVLGLMLCLMVGAVFWWVSKRRKGTFATDDGITVLSSKSLGGRGRIVLLSAKDREVLLAVSDKGPALLAQWRTEDPIAGELDSGEAPRRSRRRRVTPIMGVPVITPATAPQKSASVDGLIRLRDRMPTVAQHVATDDPVADAEWARELLRATRRSVG